MVGKHSRLKSWFFQCLEGAAFRLALFLLDLYKMLFNSETMIIINKLCWFRPFVSLATGLLLAASCPAQDVSPKRSAEEVFEKELSVRIKKQRVKGKELKKLGLVDDAVGYDVDYDGFTYTIDFRNGSLVSFDDLKVECRFFYSQARSGASSSMHVDTSLSDPVMKYNEEEFNFRLKASGRYKLETRPFIIQSWVLPGGSYFTDGTPNRQECDEEGLWVRVTYTTPSGQKITRDFHDSKSLPDKVVWK